MLSRFLNNTRWMRLLFFKVAFVLFRSGLLPFKNEQRGKTLLIVGNGPSLNRTPLDSFNGPSIGMNKINLIFSKVNWRPSYIVCNNGLVMGQAKKEYKSSGIPIFLDFKGFFLGLRGRHINYFLTKQGDMFSKDFVGGVGASATVTYTALQLAYYLGASRIILVGIDHRFSGFSADTSNRRIEKYQGEDKNHFDPNYFKNQYWGIPDLHDSEKGYRNAKRFLESKGVEIYDATIDGALEIFTKISIDEAIEMCNND